MKELIGTGVALVTPFKADLSIDINALKKIVNYNIDNGIDYLVVLGTTAESATLTKQEKEVVVKTVVSVNNARLPLVLGIGGNDTNAVINEIKNTDLTNFSAILSVSPFYNKPTQEGIYQHFKAVSKACPVGIILYNVPGRTSSNMAAQTTVRLAKDFKNIVAIKEASGNMEQIMAILRDRPSNFKVLSGDDALTLPMVLMGADGVISVQAMAQPKEFSDMVRAGLAGDLQKARALHYPQLEVIDHLFAESNPAGVKACLEIKGICEAFVRLPLVSISKDRYTKLIALLN